MYKGIAVLACVLLPAAAHAQDRPTPAALKAISGTWTFDQSRSDTIPRNPMMMLRGQRGSPAPSSSAGPPAGGGGGGRRSRGGGGGGGGGGGATDTGSVFGSRNTSMDRSPAMAYVVVDMMPPATLQISANDTSVTLTGDGRSSTWVTNGKTRQEALMEGGMLESEADWSATTLELQRDIPASASLKREYRVSKDGATLEIRETLKSNGQKVEKKLVFTRAQ